MKKEGMSVQFSKAEFLNLGNPVGSKMLDVVKMFPKLMAMRIVNNYNKVRSLFLFLL